MPQYHGYNNVIGGSANIKVAECDFDTLLEPDSWQGSNCIVLKVYLFDFILLFPPSHFVCPLFHFGMFQNIVLFLKIKTINLLMLLLYPY